MYKLMVGGHYFANWLAYKINNRAAPNSVS